jgi:hypothetical protein
MTAFTWRAGRTERDASKNSSFRPVKCNASGAYDRWRCTVQDCPSHVIVVVGEVGLSGIVEPRRK